ncbi:DUF1163 domain-containing protein [Emergencia timonensis]|uniref:DUF1163 domain-containing protein n=1 Tax=Emergencia timonensis TaxID=1776384 RepID=A0A415DST1_9FIRM|nr:DUF1163 domain-containing protein [Emergencia timonensis]
MNVRARRWQLLVADCRLRTKTKSAFYCHHNFLQLESSSQI